MRQARFEVGDAQDLGPVDALGGPFAVVAADAAPDARGQPAEAVAGGGAGGGTGRDAVVAVWGREQECDVRAVRARRSHRGCPARRAARRARRRWPIRTGSGSSAWLAGLAVVGVDEVVCPFDYPDEAALLDPLLASMIGRTAVVRAGEDVVGRRCGSGWRGTGGPGAGTGCENLFRVLVARAP